MKNSTACNELIRGRLQITRMKFICNKVMATFSLCTDIVLYLIVLCGAAVVAGSEKRGVAVGHSDFLCDDLGALQQLSWW